MVVKHIAVCGGKNRMPINEFKLETMCKNPSILMIAKRGSGKSVVCKALLDHFNDIPVGLIIAPTDVMNCYYGDFFPKSFIHYNYKSEIIERLIFRQEAMAKKKQDRKAKGKDLDCRAFIIMDDCLSKKGSWMRDQPITELLYNGRHYEIMYILTMQYPLGIIPELRSNFDYIFLLAEDFISNLKRIYDHYAGMFPDFNSFREIFVELTADYGCMVIANRGARRTFLEKIFWYNAPFGDLEKKKLSMGCNQFKKFHENNFDPKFRDRTKNLDIDEFCARRKRDKGKIHVDKVHNSEQQTNKKQAKAAR
jgi:hypothetical protein